MTVLSEARRLHKVGYDLIPLDGKRPIHKDWTKMPRLGLDELETSARQGFNVGIRLGQPMPDGRYLACLDIDILAELTEEEDEAIDALLNATTKLAPRVPCAATGSGRNSRHIYVATESPAKTRQLGRAKRSVEYSKNGSTKKGPAWTVELRGLGAQVVLPPSVHPDTQATYAWKRGHRLNGAGCVPDVTLPSRPSTSTSSTQTAPSKQPPVSLDPATLPIAPLYRQILMTGEVADYDSRSEALYAVLGSLVKDTSFTDGQIEQLVLDQPLGEKARDKPAGWIVKQCEKLRVDLNEGKRKAKGSVEAPPKLTKGNQARLAQGDGDYQALVQRHMLVNWGGKPAVFREKNNPSPWESRYDIMSVASLKAFYENQPINLGSKLVNPVDVWRTDPNRLQYLEGARLVPPDEMCPDGVFNLWQGFAARPVKQSVQPWRTFVLEVICAGNTAYAKWLEDWIADMFQQVGDKKGVAVVLRGAEGIGKGTFASALGHIMGPHYRHVTQESHLTGKFNAHFADSVLIFADELIWGGDKKHKGTLYAIVTERYTMVERKGFDAVSMRNFNRMIVASNNDWVVPTGIDSRRWFVLDVSSEHKGEVGYFDKLRKFLGKGGYAAILDYYLHRKVTSNLRKAPVTAALREQKESGFNLTTQWWVSVLERGSVAPTGSTWNTEIPKEQLRLSYMRYCEEFREKPAPASILFRELKKLMPSSWREEKRRHGEVRERVWMVGELDDCRARLDELLG